MKMPDKTWGGKDLADWLDVAANGTAFQQERALAAMRDMLIYSIATTQSEIFKIVKSLAKATHSSSADTMHTAYGVIQTVLRWLKADLAYGDDRQQRVAQVTIRSLALESKHFPEEIVKIAPDVFKLAFRDASTNRKKLDEFVQKLEQHRDNAKGSPKQEASEALKKIGQIRTAP
jgi:hypothetical protein